MAHMTLRDHFEPDQNVDPVACIPDLHGGARAQPEGVRILGVTTEFALTYLRRKRALEHFNVRKCVTRIYFAPLRSVTRQPSHV